MKRQGTDQLEISNNIKDFLCIDQAFEFNNGYRSIWTVTLFSNIILICTLEKSRDQLDLFLYFCLFSWSVNFYSLTKLCLKGFLPSVFNSRGQTVESNASNAPTYFSTGLGRTDPFLHGYATGLKRTDLFLHRYAKGLKRTHLFLHRYANRSQTHPPISQTHTPISQTYPPISQTDPPISP